jgi:pimeloyl-ACP methyl ester carboxylesterase
MISRQRWHEISGWWRSRGAASGASSQPDKGYDLGRMVLDIARVMEALHIGRANLVGHSIAGDEMTRFAITFPEKVTKLVYLEAAYDRVEAQRLEARFPKIPEALEADRESGSPEAVRALVERTEILMPDAEIRATRVFGADGRYLRPVTPEPIVRAVATMVEHPRYDAVRVPMMAVYAIYQRPGQLVARYDVADEGTRSALDQVFALWQPFALAQRELFSRSVPAARVDDIAGASHYVFISNRDRVLEDVREFLRR